MKSILLRLLAASSLLILTPSCTGDPAAGGIFWSPTKFAAERDGLVHTANAIDADTARKNAEAQRLQNQIYRKKRAY